MTHRATLALVLLAVGVSPALATSGPGCLVVVNVAAADVLNLRASPSPSARIVDTLVPGQHGIISTRSAGPRRCLGAVAGAR
jgi:hypothetical protein